MVKIPDYIGETGRKYIKKVFSEYQFGDAEIELLFLAAGCLDRLKQCREQISEEGMTVEDRFQQTKSHPLLTVERDNKLAFARYCKQLGISTGKDD